MRCRLSSPAWSAAVRSAPPVAAPPLAAGGFYLGCRNPSPAGAPAAAVAVGGGAVQVAGESAGRTRKGKHNAGGDSAGASGEASEGSDGKPAASPAEGSRSPGPGAASSAAEKTGEKGADLPPGRIALVIDDLGRSVGDLDTLERLATPLSYSVLPFEEETPQVVAALRTRGAEILCHLPMQAKHGENPGPGALRLGMSRDQLTESTRAALAAVPGAVGVNNHMGSGLSADATAMGTILAVLSARGLFFLDSRTSAQSVGYRVASSLGMPAAERQVFLDDDPSPEAIHVQFQRLLDLSRSRGEAIAIGHPRGTTLAALATEIPQAKAQGFRFVRVSAVLDRPAKIAK